MTQTEGTPPARWTCGTYDFLRDYVPMRREEVLATLNEAEALRVHVRVLQEITDKTSAMADDRWTELEALRARVTELESELFGVEDALTTVGQERDELRERLRELEASNPLGEWAEWLEDENARLLVAIESIKAGVVFLRAGAPALALETIEHALAGAAPQEGE